MTGAQGCLYCDRDKMLYRMKCYPYKCKIYRNEEWGGREHFTDTSLVSAPQCGHLCAKTPECYGFAWNKAKQECKLLKSWKIGGKTGEVSVTPNPEV